MPRYVVARLNYYDNINNIYVIEAKDEKETLRILGKDYEFEESLSVEEMQERFFNGDESVSIPLLVPNSVSLKLP